ncbi:DsrE family protein [Sanguibacter antarcticus]|uniref:Putative peroxiredoxin n=1 Tax=Sanguibacter antarcticus TaxID=372484 RepID=A0A2A9E677_9MICO|nr:DsrE family protein [Sanguibacter antarcticus]PFG34333.1 putative peroxiredoxin [Sanguibacter antarcticus]
MSEPDSTASQRLVIKSTGGTTTPETTNQAFTVAAAALAAGVEVSVWLTGESSWFAVPGRADELVVEHAVAIRDLLSVVLEAGTLTVCTQCAVRRGIDATDLLPGVRIAGASTFVEEIMVPGTQALVY